MNRARALLRDPITLAGILAGVVVVALLVAYAVVPRPYVTGGNGVRPLSLIATIPSGDRLCAYDVSIPRETAAIQISMAPETVPTDVQVSVKAGERVIRRARVGVSAFQPTTARFAPLPEDVTARVCVEPSDHGVAVAGALDLQTNDRPLVLAGESLDARLGMLFLPEEGDRRSLVSQWATVMERAAVFRPGFVVPALLWVVMLVVLPVAFVAAIVGVARGVRRKRAVWLLAAVAFMSAASWSVITLPFDSPDESEHFAYVQSVAEQQKRPDSTPTELGPYSAAQTLTLEALRHPTRVGGSDQRPPWTEEARRQYDEVVEGAALDNGGGYTDATRLHHPAYYSLLLPAYALAGDDIITQLTLARLLSALLGVIVALCAFGIVRELLPARPELALTAGLLVALHPMFSFIAGSVNNDVGVNAGAAVVAYLGIRLLRRPTTWVFAGLGAALAVTPVLKATGFSLYPPVLLVLAGYVWRHRQWRVIAKAGSALAVTFVGVTVALRGALSAAVTQGAVGSGGGEGAVNAGILSSLGGKLSYTWQVVFPRLPSMQEHFVMSWPFWDIYIVRGWGAFGWYSFLYPRAVFIAILGVIGALVVLGAKALWERRSRVRGWGWEVLFLISVPVTVLTAISFAYYSEQPQPVPGEQGRYLFTAAAPLAALAAGALIGLPARWQRPGAVVLVIGMAGLAYAGRLTYLVGVFT